jgi:hypothetical protein
MLLKSRLLFKLGLAFCDVDLKLAGLFAASGPEMTA